MVIPKLFLDDSLEQKYCAEDSKGVVLHGRGQPNMRCSRRGYVAVLGMPIARQCHGDWGSSRQTRRTAQLHRCIATSSSQEA